MSDAAKGRSPVRRALRLLAAAWVAVGLILVAAAAIEALGLLLQIPEGRPPAGQPSAGAAACADGAGWWDEYHKEYGEVDSSLDWQPYVYWRSRPHSGSLVNVDEQGRRRTWSASPAGPSRKVFVLGGSSVWGVGARDDGTVPSHVARLLAQAGVAAEVTNLGEIGWVGTQEVLALELELRRGNVPDLAVFVDGFNDAMVACRGCTAGVTMNEENRRHEFNLLSRPAEMLRRGVAGLAARSVVARLAAAGAPAEPPRWGCLAPGGDWTPVLVDEAVAAYRANVRWARALAAEYGFEVRFYWQPAVWDRRSPTAFEADRAADLGPLCPDVRRRIGDRLVRWGEEPGGLAVASLASALDAAEGCVFLDACHVTERGNELIARRIVEDVLPLLRP
jgi:hypothetical protein